MTPRIQFIPEAPKARRFIEDLKEQFWWNGMKREIAFYIAWCDVC
jgi:hypothetical protein